ncbi:LacI family transcriptional regulator [Litorilinea aerophila]|uniref:LacI family transcriptional regulator n=1 Tax=Litorilinea aerophila TaxID=1204385 RepID=A0A540VCX2_9CHLR|nr:LacI family DNA-binding transcriptional regulator [Litorilinea aerophila]MCC9077657.1 LacI family transcriptional regulator [Litorilinea aerophila]OUC05994.1 hypothetical protein RY27_23785 [Litorilinea aerophila]
MSHSVKRRPRQADVARLAGVSPTTVSLVLNNRVGGNVRIRPETRQRVLDAVARLGYVADPAARSLAGGQNRLLGVFTFEAIFPIQQRDFYYPFLVGIEREAGRLGYDLLLFTSSTGTDGKRRLYQRGNNRLRMADGAVLLGNEENKQELSRLLAEGYPFVFVGRREVPGGELSYVAADYTTATAQVLAHFFAHGHRRVAYLAHPIETESMADRRAGYRLAHREAGLEPDPNLLFQRPSAEITAAWLHTLRAQGITGMVTEMGEHVPALMAAIHAAGWSLPGDFSLAFLGDPHLNDDHDDLPRDCTTFTIPREEMGIQAVRLLTQMLSNPEGGGPRRLTLPCRFVPGSTVGPPPPLPNP